MTAGYSGTPLAKKLGLRDGMTWVALHAPPDYRDWLGDLPPGASIRTRLRGTPAAVHLFATERAALETSLAGLRERIAPDGIVWVSWPKKAAKVPTDVTEDVIRAVALPLGFVDVKVCAVSEVWSGLKLVIRKELRGPAA